MRSDSQLDGAAGEREELRERIERWMRTPLDVLAVALLGIIVAEFAQELPAEWRTVVSALSWFIYAVFTGYFTVQLLLAPDKAAYLRRNWLAAISVVLPAFRTLRVLRAARAVRSLRLVRVLTATNRGTRALGEVLGRYRFGRVLGLTVAVTAVGAAALVSFEPAATAMSYGDALWHTLALVTTIGSSFEPRTLEGRVLTVLLVVWGLGVFGYATGSVASYFLGRGPKEDGASDLAELREEVRELRRAVASLGRVPEREGAAAPGCADEASRGGSEREEP